MQSKPRQVFTRARVQSDVERMLTIYRRSGRYNAVVEPKIIRLEQGRVDLVFEINEGDVTGIKRISFVGNEHFSDGTLRGKIRTTESAWWRFLSSDDRFDPDRLNLDRELLRKFYLSEGYADFRVVSAVAELAPDRDGLLHHLHDQRGRALQVRQGRGHVALPGPRYRYAARPTSR